jgi:hypothetical protein
MITGYDITKSIFRFSGQNLNVKAFHIVVFIYLGEISNECNWARYVEISREKLLRITGIGTQVTYIKVLKQLEEWGAIKIHQYSQNQFNPYDIIEIKESFIKKHKSLLNHNEVSANLLPDQSEDIYIKTIELDNLKTLKGIDVFFEKKEFFKYQKLDEYGHELFSNNFKLLIKENFILLSEKDFSQVNFEIKFREPKIPNTSNDIIEQSLVFDILSFFGFEPENDVEKKIQVEEFIKVLTDFDKIDHFQGQFIAYKKYKSVTGEKVHGFASFLGLNKKDFLNGGWNSENWEFKLKNLPNKDSKKDNLNNNYNVGETDHGIEL